MTRSEAGKLGGYASRAHSLELHKIYKEQYDANPKTCIYCGRILPYDKRRNKFCDGSCAAIYNNHKRSKTTHSDKQNKKAQRSPRITTPKRYRPQKFCEECGQPLHTYQRYSRRFCSYDCSVKFAAHKQAEKLMQKFAAIEAAGEFPKYFQGEADRRLVRKYLEHKYGHKCSICGIIEWMGKPVPIIVDHIDGNALNRKLENFRLVCPNCDAQLPTYKAKNKHGRKWRRKYEQR